MSLQPANEHSYHLGRDITFSRCPTLVALGECFDFASRGSLGLQHITVIDFLPYTRKKDKDTRDYRREIGNQVLRILHAKRPFAVLCMWQNKEEVSSSITPFRSSAVGNTFDKPIDHSGWDHHTKRTEEFHPSCAIYHSSTESAFRQLLLLEVARACGELRGDWREEG